MTSTKSLSMLFVLSIVTVSRNGVSGFLESQTSPMNQYCQRHHGRRISEGLSHSTFENRIRIGFAVSSMKLSFHDDNNHDDLVDHSSHVSGKETNPYRQLGRRSLLVNGVVAASGVLFNFAQVAGARDELFKPNPLTNPLLEQIRIIEQAEADKTKYGGELTANDASMMKATASSYPKLLVPILVIDQELSYIEALLSSSRESNNYNNNNNNNNSAINNDAEKETMKTNWSSALNVIRQKKYEKIEFKKIFNAYGNNIYYSDPDRANLYLGGGAAPRTEQSMAYLFRNDILTNVEALRADLEYRIQSNDQEDIEDLYQYANAASSAMKKYLTIVPPKELESARNELMMAAGKEQE